MDRLLAFIAENHDWLRERFSPTRLRKRLRRATTTLAPFLRGLLFLAIFSAALLWILDGTRFLRRHQLASLLIAIPILTLAAAPLVSATGHWANRRALRRRRHADQCLRCGYHMRGNITNTCPECGRHFVPARAIALQHTIEAALPFLKPPRRRRSSS